MKTNIGVTFGALNSWYLNTDTMTINEDCLCEDIMWLYYKDKRYQKALVGGKRKMENIVWEMLAHLARLRIAENEYPYSQDHYASNYQLKKWLDEYGRGNPLAEAVEELSIMRQCYNIALTKGGYYEKSIVKDGNFVVTPYCAQEGYEVYQAMRTTGGNFCLFDIKLGIPR